MQQLRVTKVCPFMLCLQRIKGLHDASASNNFIIVSAETFIDDPHDALQRLKVQMKYRFKTV